MRLSSHELQILKEATGPWAQVVHPERGALETDARHRFEAAACLQPKGLVRELRPPSDPGPCRRYVATGAGLRRLRVA